MGRFRIEADGWGQAACTLELRDATIEEGEELAHECMDAVAGLSCVGASGGYRTTVRIHGSSVRSVMEAVRYCVESSYCVAQQ